MIVVIQSSPDRTNSVLRLSGRVFRCCSGSGGMKSKKREGDQATPIGTWPLRRVFYRSDRIAAPNTGLAVVEITRVMGWSDDPKDPEHYNRLVTLPYSHSHEVFWRDDSLYDLVLEIGYNDEPPVPGLGSAIFLHVAHPGYGSPTAGCIALAIEDLIEILGALAPGDMIHVAPPPY